MILKFRVWDKDLKKMHVCGEDIHDSISFDEDGVAYYYNLQNGCGSSTDESVYILMQYTGLTDKNGKEIFEGDILHHTWNSGHDHILETISEVKWNNAAFFVDDKKRSDWLLSVHTLVDWAEVEIIGNIHENPELLEVPGL